MSRTSRLALAVFATLTLGAGAAQATGDIRVVNLSSQMIHPYFRSNCWAPAIIDAQPGTWVFFGGIVPGTQFTWDAFYGLFDPKCKNPVVKFTFTLDGEDPPHETDVDRTVLIQYDATGNHRIVLGNRVVVTEDAAE